MDEEENNRRLVTVEAKRAFLTWWTCFRISFKGTSAHFRTLFWNGASLLFGAANDFLQNLGTALSSVFPLQFLSCIQCWSHCICHYKFLCQLPF